VATSGNSRRRAKDAVDRRRIGNPCGAILPLHSPAAHKRGDAPQPEIPPWSYEVHELPLVRLHRRSCWLSSALRRKARERQGRYNRPRRLNCPANSRAYEGAAPQSMRSAVGRAVPNLTGRFRLPSNPVTLAAQAWFGVKAGLSDRLRPLNIGPRALGGLVSRSSRMVWRVNESSDPSVLAMTSNA